MLKFQREVLRLWFNVFKINILHKFKQWKLLPREREREREREWIIGAKTSVAPRSMKNKNFISEKHVIHTYWWPFQEKFTICMQNPKPTQSLPSLTQ